MKDNLLKIRVIAISESPRCWPPALNPKDTPATPQLRQPIDYTKISDTTSYARPTGTRAACGSGVCSFPNDLF